MINCSVWPIERTLSGAITPGQSGPESNDNEMVLYISLSSRTGASSPCICFYINIIIIAKSEDDKTEINSKEGLSFLMFIID